MSDPAPVLVYVRDLMFCSRIMSAAQAAQIPLKIVRDANHLQEQFAQRLLVDLNHPGAIDAARKWKARQGGIIIGFVSHTDEATIAQAKEAGVDQILARGQFVQILSQVLRGD